MQNFIKINTADNVIVCLANIKKGDEIIVDGKTVTMLQDTPRGHKVVITDLNKGENVIKYGYPIGFVTEDVKAGKWVNDENIHTNLSGILDYKYEPVGKELEIENENRTFMAYQ
ncbi:MAG: UxaA family hydrolase, partial [Prevotellaceae bacterium]|nr:UxaA family hydrolase [Prevotellaceae bacterium]